MKTKRDFYDGEGITLTDDTADTTAPVWIQVAKQGAFAGHPAGPFKLDLKTFGEIIANFKATTNRAIPLDYEHCSEMDPTSGTIPTNGAPAVGWLTDLKIEGGNLWGLVEWGEQARAQIRAGEYRFLSPAIRFESKDRVTGKPVGARLTSCALTNMPFLDGMEPLAAKDGDPAVTMDLGISDVHTPGSSGKREKLAKCMSDVRTALNAHAPKGTVCGDLHYSSHELLACLDDMPPDGESAAMKLRDAEGQAARSTLLLRQAQAEIESKDAELVALRDAKAARDDRDVHEEVEAAFETYADRMKYTPADKSLLLSWRRSDPTGFAARHPPIRASERVLLRDIVPPNPRPQMPTVVPSSPERIRQIQRERRVDFGEAQMIEAQERRARSRREAAAEDIG